MKLSENDMQQKSHLLRQSGRRRNCLNFTLIFTLGRTGFEKLGAWTSNPCIQNEKLQPVPIVPRWSQKADRREPAAYR